ncbi:hypothetical protein EUGRSUZ_K00403 [Eucalyptus grandis]|uniref:Uncharacterized protein n=2 Tax=Eucalyptus grandis TaxID=71139 RepID=A0ACC3IRV2_EUCGR|nr:hypothetical protein EUGRSUZ_K00403 [Eucalyptus grandis]
MMQNQITNKRDPPANRIATSARSSLKDHDSRLRDQIQPRQCANLGANPKTKRKNQKKGLNHIQRTHIARKKYTKRKKKKKKKKKTKRRSIRGEISTGIVPERLGIGSSGAQTGRLATSLGSPLVAEELRLAAEESMRGRSWASVGSSASSSEVERLMQEQRSREAKKAAATLVPTQEATPFSFS